MQITITQEDVDLGTRRDTWNCPVARALFRATGKKYVVCMHYVRPLGDTSHAAHRSTTFEIRQFISDFDHGIICSPKLPRTFEIQL